MRTYLECFTGSKRSRSFIMDLLVVNLETSSVKKWGSLSKEQL